MVAASSNPKRKRRWLRYSLRMMLVVILLLSLWLGYLANRSAKQRRAVALVRDLGGSVFYECQEKRIRQVFGGTRRKGRTSSPGFSMTAIYEPVSDDHLLHEYLGHDWLHDVVHVHLAGPDVTDEQLAKVIGGLPNIVELTLTDCALTEAGGLGRIASLERLEVVGIGQSAPGTITEGSVARLRRQRPDLRVYYPWIVPPSEQTANTPAK